VKNWWETISIEDILDVTSRLEQGEWIFDICHNVRFVHSSVRTVPDKTERIKGSADCLDNIKCQQSVTGSVCDATQPQSCWKEQYQRVWLWVSYIFIALEINTFILLKYMCIVQKCIYTVHTVHIYILQVCISTSV